MDKCIGTEHDLLREVRQKEEEASVPLATLEA